MTVLRDVTDGETLHAVLSAQGNSSHFLPMNRFWLTNNFNSVGAATVTQYQSIRQPCENLDELRGFRFAHSQFQSIFFVLPIELRLQVYNAYLRASMTHTYFERATGCECPACEARCLRESNDLEYDGGRSFTEETILPKHQSSLAGVVNLFRTCRQIYDEARPSLQLVNDFCFDGKARGCPTLRKASRTLSVHRGLKLGKALLTNATFFFNMDLFNLRPNRAVFQNFYAAIFKVYYEIATPIHIANVKIIIRLTNAVTITDFLPLVRACEMMHGVKHCTVQIGYSEAGLMQITPAEQYLFYLIAAEIESAAIMDPDEIKKRYRSASLHFARARTIHAHLPCNVIYHAPPVYDERMFKLWDDGTFNHDRYDLPTRAEQKASKIDFPAAMRAMEVIGSDLDARAPDFIPMRPGLPESYNRHYPLEFMLP